MNEILGLMLIPILEALEVLLTIPKLTPWLNHKISHLTPFPMDREVFRADAVRLEAIGPAPDEENKGSRKEIKKGFSSVLIFQI